MIAAGGASTSPPVGGSAPASLQHLETIDHSVCLDDASGSSTDGFASERRLTSEGSNPFVEFADGSFIGDYTQAAVGANGVVHTAWTLPRQARRHVREPGRVHRELHAVVTIDAGATGHARSVAPARRIRVCHRPFTSC